MADNSGDPTRLSELRAQIDAVDESVHRLLMQRATVIDELIRVKGASRGGAAFRPAREADMMRRLAARHAGPLPLTAVEHLWREIISTFTALQAPFEAFVSTGGDPVAAVETARFTVGFSVPMHVMADAGGVVREISRGGDRLGIVLLSETDTAWWDGLGEALIVSRLPFIEAPGRQADTPAVVLAPPLADPTPFEITAFAVKGRAAHEPLPEGVDKLAAAAGSELVAFRGERAALSQALGADLDIRRVGGYAAPLTVTGD